MSRGGSGRGQGRKPLSKGERKITLSTRQPPDVIEWLDREVERTGEARADIIEGALRRRMKNARD